MKWFNDFDYELTPVDIPEIEDKGPIESYEFMRCGVENGDLGRPTIYWFFIPKDPKPELETFENDIGFWT